MVDTTIVGGPRIAWRPNNVRRLHRAQSDRFPRVRLTWHVAKGLRRPNPRAGVFLIVGTGGALAPRFVGRRVNHTFESPRYIGSHHDAAKTGTNGRVRGVGDPYRNKGFT